MTASKQHYSKNSPRKRKTRPPTDQRNRADEARKRLGVDVEAVAQCRKITPLLSEAGLTRERVIDILDSDDAVDSRTFLGKYRSISASDLPCLTLEEICIAAGLTTRRLWELIQGARLEQSHDSVKMMIAENRSKVMAMAIKAATTGVPLLNAVGQPFLDKNGEPILSVMGDMKATELLWKADGTLPVPKGMTVYLNQQNNLPGPQNDPENELPLAGMDETLKEIQRVVSTPQLAAPKVEVPIIEAEYEEVAIGH